MEDQKQEQEFTVPPHPLLDLKLNPQNQFKAKTLIIALYGPASLFAHSIVAGTQVSARLNFNRAKQLALASVYMNGQNAYIIFEEEPKKMMEVHFASFVKQNFIFESCVIIASVSAKILEKEPQPTLKFMCTSKWSEKPPCQTYQEGLTGLHADMLQWGQIENLPVCCYIGVMGEYELTSKIIEEVYGLLRGKYGMDGKKEIQKQISSYNMKKYSTNLYL